MYSLWQYLSVSTKMFHREFWPWPAFIITFKPWEVGLSYFTCVFLLKRPFRQYQLFLPITYILIFFYLIYHFWNVTGRDFIYHMCITRDKTFSNVLNLMTFTSKFDLHFKPTRPRKRGTHTSLNLLVLSYYSELLDCFYKFIDIVV